ncbi:PilZ domain-containing protein [Alteromonas oceanisediminis]|uniref:PilZ domain-containing protein n=1 Tax=Alteromonas oceanisediminis TaxID=2836180 RepID=UPI001BDAD1F6|nr:PilZ domain-containing protein [Alteromonas oceanisediminis]MBT0587263.1 PilZ domain-containing protein [Alteromonas oceanisediminis]
MTTPFDALSNDEKQQQFTEFFLIKHQLNVNFRTIDKAEIPAVDQLEEHMPYAFKIAGELASVEAQAIRPLRNLSSHAAELAEFLNAQARKIDIMMSYILHQQDDESMRYKSVRFGGGGIEVHSDHPLDAGTSVELKIFLSEEAAAVFCYAEVISCETIEDGYQIAFIFSRIRESDQELLVRASLHLQAQQLRKRSESNRVQ